MNLCSRPAVFVSACASCDVAWPAASCESMGCVAITVTSPWAVGTR